MKDEKRYSRSYKATDSDYKAAMKRAKKNKVPLAQTIENWVKLYGQGYCVGLIESLTGSVGITNPKIIKDHNKQL